MPTVASNVVIPTVSSLTIGNYRTPTAVLGFGQQLDSAAFYVESQDFQVALMAGSTVGAAISALTVTASATNTINGPDFVNTVHKGGKFFINFTTVAATCTVRLNIQAKDPLSLGYVTIASLSVDGIATASGGTGVLNVIAIYPGIGTAGGANTTNFNDVFTRTMRVQASITATASQAGAATSISVGLTKIV